MDLAIIVLVYLVLLAVSKRSYIKAWWMGRKSANWPLAPATFEDGDVTLVPDRYKDGFVLNVSFSYTVSGEIYGGVYEGGYYQSARDANQVLESIKAGPLYVRYNPSQPQTYSIDPFRDVRPN